MNDSGLSSHLEVNNIDVFYEGIQVLWDVSIEIKEGESVALVGPNGAGKTTLLKSISGLVRPEEGSIIFKGKRIDGLNAYDIAELGVIQVPEGRRIYSTLTVKENLLMGCYIKKLREKSEELLGRVYDLFPILGKRADQKAKSFSGGEQQMLAIARSLMADPDLLMLDEFALGLAPKIISDVYKKVEEIMKQGLTILLVDENPERSLRYSDRGYVIESGEVVLQGNSDELLENEDLEKAYFGLEGEI